MKYNPSKLNCLNKNHDRSKITGVTLTTPRNRIEMTIIPSLDHQRELGTWKHFWAKSEDPELLFGLFWYKMSLSERLTMIIVFLVWFYVILCRLWAYNKYEARQPYQQNLFWDSRWPCKVFITFWCQDYNQFLRFILTKIGQNR